MDVGNGQELAVRVIQLFKTLQLIKQISSHF